ncbi:MAG: 3-deoxy-8-phosphooctulonate synthase [Syntrophorhabdaceae bacterium]|nr:3-deoxy-8-phosphooctulonate synthase [Syntrophorhabdaceae bacterium]
MQKEITIGNVTIGRRPFVFIGGPCVIEGRDITLKTARSLARITGELGVPFIFKSSYDKANRTSISGFRGPGIDEGLAILKEVKTELGVPVLTDVHSAGEAEAAAAVVDVLQVPALLSRQTDILTACGRTGKAVNIKKGQFLSPRDMVHAIRKVESTGNGNIIVTERGTSFGYHALVNDFRAIPIMQDFGYPVVFDATHSVQQPSAMTDRSGGESRFIVPLARAAVAVGIEGIFMEVHPDPKMALCDGDNSLPLDELAPVLRTLKRIEEALWTT